MIMYDKLHTLFVRYDDMLHGVGIEDGQSPSPHSPLDLNHIKWMCEYMRSVTDSASERYTTEDIHKVNRWLGYIQCALTGAGIVNLIEEMDATREALRP
jgi:hypothetical protein